MVTVSFFLAAFKILSLSLTFDILIMMCFSVDFFGSNLFGTLYVSWTYISISFAKLGKFSFIIFSSKFSISCSSSSSGIPMIWLLAHLEMSQRFLSLSLLFFLVLVSSFCSGLMFFFLMFQIVNLNPGFLPFTVGSLWILYFT